MKHVKIFDTVANLNKFKLTQDYITPNVSLCEDNPSVIYYDPYVAPAQNGGSNEVPGGGSTEIPGGNSSNPGEVVNP